MYKGGGGKMTQDNLKLSVMLPAYNEADNIEEAVDKNLQRTKFKTNQKMENKQKKCVILLPCYNEEKNLEQLISNIHETIGQSIPYEVIAVNDGSTDHTEEVLKNLTGKYPLKMVRHDKNMGLAAAYRTTISAALANSSLEDIIITMDADNTQNPFYIKRMLNEVHNGIDIVIGSRYVDGGRQLNVPLHRAILSRVINFLIRKIAELPIKDATSGYRCYRASIIVTAVATYQSKFIESQGFEVPLEVLIKTCSCNSKVNVKEIPITLDYSRKAGKSKLKLIPTISLYLKLLLKIYFWKKSLRDFY